MACSLDGYITGPDGEYDWIVMGPDIDFAELFAEFDTALLGRRSYEALTGPLPGMDLIAFSTSLRQEEHPDVTIVADRVAEMLDELRRAPGKGIWLFGGGELFRSLLALDRVDTVELAVVPIVLGGGRPFLPAPAPCRALTLTGQRVYEKCGIVALTYDVAAG